MVKAKKRIDKHKNQESFDMLSKILVNKYKIEKMKYTSIGCSAIISFGKKKYIIQLEPANLIPFKDKNAKLPTPMIYDEPSEEVIIMEALRKGMVGYIQKYGKEGTAEQVVNLLNTL